jgi:UDP-N-acetylmuramoyl-L-alanyl-D-glutamate--2,6-diaminopimelate ligase
LNKLADILSQVQSVLTHGNTDIEISQLIIDSRKIGRGDCFVAIKGTVTDGHQYINQVIISGAICIICEVLPESLQENICYVKIENTSQALGLLAANFYNHPTKHLKLVGVTGTNGKTTIATVLFNLFKKLGYSCGLISTVQNQIDNKVIPATHTTPDAVSLQELLSKMYEAGCTYVFMEVSSHAVHQHRIAGCNFTGAIFSNITHDHLDYHITFDNYIAAKKMFFDQLPKTAFALTNIDDKRGMVMLQNTVASKKVYGLKNMADYKGKILENALNGLVVDINNTEVYCRMIGSFNAYNILAVYGTAIELGQDKTDVLSAISTLTGAPGRFDYIQSERDQILGIVDYAHTPDALLNVLATINNLKQDNAQVYTLVGCGGNRDSSKRPIMAQVACEHSDKVIFTSDNPRNEHPETIIKEMEAGVPVNHHRKFISITNRKDAIKAICQMAKAKDIILIAGKGHESYQEINGVKYDFDDKQILIETFKQLER